MNLLFRPFAHPNQSARQRIIHIAQPQRPHPRQLPRLRHHGSRRAQKMGRRWIGIEMGEHARRTACRDCKSARRRAGRHQQGGELAGGGSFRFLRLVPRCSTKPAPSTLTRFSTLAAFVWMQETGTSLRHRAGRFEPLPATWHNGGGLLLLLNGILGDKRPNAGNVLTRRAAGADHRVPGQRPSPRVIYGESNRLGEERPRKRWCSSSPSPA